MMKPRSKRKVILAGLPAGFIDNLPPEDQRALLEAVGKPAMLNGYDEDGRAELEFVDGEVEFHTIWVDPVFVATR